MYIFTVKMFALWQIITTLITTTLVALEIISGVSGSATCPYYCDCEGRTKAVSCLNSMYDQVPDQLPDNLKSLHLEYQNLTILDQISKKPLIHLRHLALPRNQIRIVLEDALAVAPRLKTLDLSHNNLDCLPRAITKQRQLKELYLQNNQISLLDAHLFENLTQLQALDLSGNFFLFLPLHVFSPLRYLVTLDLSNNSIMLLDKEIFGLLYNLEELRLSHNKIRNIEHGWLSGMPNLWVLEMDYALDRRLDKSKSINSYHDHLLGIPMGATMSNLENVSIVGNGITSIPCVHLLKMPRLVHVNISHNEIYQVEKECFLTLDYLEYLDLSHNRITELEFRSFSNLSNLKTLNLSNNRLSILPAELLQNTPISIFDVSSNRIKKKKNDTFNDIWSLEYLHLHHNRIRSIANHAFRTLNSLSYIDLEANDLRSIRYQFANVSSLTTLILNKNRLRHFAPDALAGTSVNVLILDTNLLTTLDESVLHYIPRLMHLTLHTNPWNCDCKLRWIKSALDNPERTLWGYDLSIDLVQCATPLRYANKSMFYSVEGTYNMLCTTYASKLAIQLIVGISFAIIFTSTVLYVLKLYCKIKKLERTGADTSKCLS
ncbi:uncharacterized protein [Amphiura filiformis]|uniref:uncharacterized protein n=1 Tax=Amphiura filiformis TaxID=82378 RepID=UPI003B20B7AE